MKQIFHLVNGAVKRNAAQAVMQAPENYRVEIKERTRSLDQNALLWSCLNDLSRQVYWPINGKREKLSPDDWKDILSASLDQENRIAMGVRGGYVMLGRRTSKMTVKQMTELIEFIHSFGAEQNVRWSPTSIGGVHD